jgi:hypothetical protein
MHLIPISSSLLTFGLRLAQRDALPIDRHLISPDEPSGFINSDRFGSSSDRQISAGQVDELK